MPKKATPNVPHCLIKGITDAPQKHPSMNQQNNPPEKLAEVRRQLQQVVFYCPGTRSNGHHRCSLSDVADHSLLPQTSVDL